MKDLNEIFYLVGVFALVFFFASVAALIAGKVLKAKDKTILQLIFVLTVIMFAKGIYDAQNFHVETIEITSDKIDSEYNLVLISDMHIGSESPAYLSKVVDGVIALNPDLLLIGGDMVDNRATTIEDLSALRRLESPRYFVYGNHDSMVRQSMEQNGHDLNNSDLFEVLDNEKATLRNLDIFGMADNHRRQGEVSVKAAIEDIGLDRSKYNIVLIHSPVQVDDISQAGIDLMLAGHTHGGQIFPYHFMHKLDLGYLYGLYEVGPMKLYVTSGTGVWGPNFRLGTKNEIVQILLKPGP